MELVRAFKIKCDAEKGCNGNVSYIDQKGFVYCGIHGPIRSFYRSCRKLTPQEIEIIKEGKPLAQY